MRIAKFLSLAGVAVVAACSSSGTPAPAPQPAPSRAPAAAPAPTPAPTPAPAPAASPAPAGGAPGGQGGRGGPQLTPEQRAARRDSITNLRSQQAKDVMARIAGRENEPATAVFKNIQLMKNVTAGQLVTAMDQGIGRALTADCTSCHILTDFASDTVARKARARIMLNMVNKINTDPDLLSKLPNRPGAPPRAINCNTCHRGGNAGNPAQLP